MQTANDEGAPHSMRIAAHGKISGLVTFALKFLKENPTRPLVLHTLPHKRDLTRQDGKDVSATEPVSKKQKIAPSTNDIPRLISVVEIIKREFTDAPLHQYNELGCLDEPAVEEGAVRAVIPNEPGEERQAALQEMLQGKNHIPIQRTPYMKITLSRVVLPESETAGATYQAPVPKKVSRSAKARRRRRAKEKTDVPGENHEEGDVDAMEVIPT
ncbi:hypothetical protein FRC08_005442 [Ceratobasidium sp. 394]|nr:hypothetical protein FRC08_005442 [Ceratobasidium sp. 394]KAG9092253.1 hypothetical protein FS749_015888 [Ceratobasidium sp. UAMH 11750]